MTKIIKLHTKEEREIPQEECSICRCNFDPDGEGGLIGSLGILPVQFCPMCLSGIFQMVDYLRGKEEERFDE